MSADAFLKDAVDFKILVVTRHLAAEETVTFRRNVGAQISQIPKPTRRMAANVELDKSKSSMVCGMWSRPGMALGDTGGACFLLSFEIYIYILASRKFRNFKIHNCRWDLIIFGVGSCLV